MRKEAICAVHLITHIASIETDKPRSVLISRAAFGPVVTLLRVVHLNFANTYVKPVSFRLQYTIKYSQKASSTMQSQEALDARAD
jgi:hypothetical protein